MHHIISIILKYIVFFYVLSKLLQYITCYKLYYMLQVILYVLLNSFNIEYQSKSGDIINIDA